MLRRSLDGRLSSPLDWQVVEGTEPTLYDVDLGLFDGLPQPLEDQGQFKSIALVLKHFGEAVFSKGGCIGVCLYSGAADYPSLRQVSEAMDRRDVAIDYIDLLTTHLPVDCPAYIELDVTGIEDPVKRLLLLAKDAYQHVRVLARGLPPHIVLAREGDRPSKGILLPGKENRLPMEGLERALKHLDEEQQPYRVISEPQLIYEWDGLDELIVCPELVTPLGWRQIDGFKAAGGVVLLG